MRRFNIYCWQYAGKKVSAGHRPREAFGLITCYFLLVDTIYTSTDSFIVVKIGKGCKDASSHIWCVCKYLSICLRSCLRECVYLQFCQPALRSGPGYGSQRLFHIWCCWLSWHWLHSGSSLLFPSPLFTLPTFLSPYLSHALACCRENADISHTCTNAHNEVAIAVFFTAHVHFCIYTQSQTFAHVHSSHTARILIKGRR